MDSLNPISLELEMMVKSPVLCPNSCPICVRKHVLRPIRRDDSRLFESMTCFSWLRLTAYKIGMQGFARVYRGYFDRLLLELEDPYLGGKSVHPYIDMTFQTFLSEFLSRLEMRIACPPIHRLPNSVLLMSSSCLA